MRKVLLKIIEIGGREIVMKNTHGGDTTLFTACVHKASIEITSKLLEVGGRELMMEKSRSGETPLLVAYKKNLQ